MNYKLSEELLYGQYKIKIHMPKHSIAIIDGENIVYLDGPMLIVELMSSDELKRYHNLKTGPESVISSVDDVLVKDKLIGIVDYEDYEISLDFTPAGCIKWIADAIYAKSYSYLANYKEEYTVFHENVLFVEQIGSIVSKYMNTPYAEVIKYPISELFRLHAIIQQTYPQEVRDFRAEDEEVSDGEQ